MGIIAKMAHRYFNRYSRMHTFPNYIDVEDFISWAVECVLINIDKFDPSRGNPSTFVSNYAIWGIKNEMRNITQNWKPNIQVNFEDYGNDEADENINLIDLVAPDCSFENKCELVDSINKFFRYCNNLSPRNAEILRYRFLEGETMETIAGKFNITKERVRQIQARLIERFRKHIKI